MLIVSLSTIPSRFDLIAPALNSLRDQTAQIDRIILYIPHEYRRFKDYDGSLPKVPDGVEIRRASKDYGPATKVFCAVQEFADQDCDILFCDDDRIYGRTWAQTMLEARAEHPDACIATMGREASTLFDSQQIRTHHPRVVKREWQKDYWFLLRYALWYMIRRLPSRPDRPRRKVFKTAGYIDILMGFGGALVKPSFFEPEDFDIPDGCWTVDDIWISGMLARKGIGIWIPANVNEPANSSAYWEHPLWAATIEDISRVDAENLTFDYLQKTFGIWP